MTNKKRIVSLVLIYFTANLVAFPQNKVDDFRENFMKINFYKTKFENIKGYYFEGYEQSKFGKFKKDIDSIKIYAQKPNYSRTELTYPNKISYCYNGIELVKVSAATDFKPQEIPLKTNPAIKQAIFSMFLNGFVSRSYIIKENLIEKLKIISDSTLIDGKRYYKLTQRLNEEFEFEYFIEFDTFFLFRENTIKNGEITNQIDYSDYRKVEGIYFPFKKIDNNILAGAINERIIQKLTLNPTIPKGFFDCL